MSEYIAVKLRNLVKKRSPGHCEYCRIPEDFSPQPFCFEHILPIVASGKLHKKISPLLVKVATHSKPHEPNLKTK